jgi:hypothetical protein
MRPHVASRKRFRRRAVAIVFYSLALLVGLLRAPAQTEADFSSNPGETDATNFVVPVALDGLVSKAANLFDLEGKSLRFTPQGDGSYTIELLPDATTMACNRVLQDDDAEPDGPFQAKGWAVRLPFSFPFGGKTWSKIYVNRNGNLSFAKHEGAYWPQRDPWPDGGMRSMAATIDSNAAAGLEQMIAVLWAPYEPNPAVSEVRLEAQDNCLAVTWHVVRSYAGQVVAGPCTFQVRLYPTGVIEMAYLKVPEKDGIVGLFTGLPVNGPLLEHWQHSHSAADPSVAIASADIYDAGSTLKFVLSMKTDAPLHVAQGMLAYRCLFKVNGYLEQVATNVTDKPFGSSSLGATPHTAGYAIHGKTVEIYVSKVAFAGCDKIYPGWNVTWWGLPGRFDQSPADLRPGVDLTKVTPGETDLSSTHDARSGNIFEVFHYSEVTKKADRLLKEIYQQLPPDDDIALVFTDFRIDDLYGQGGGAWHVNFPIQGIGGGADQPRSTKELGSTKLQINIANVWVGAPLFAESGTDPEGRHWFNYALGVKWIAHESTHRWGMTLVTRNPHTDQQVDLGDSVGHWIEGMNTPALFPMGGHYLDHPSPGPSIMGGSVWQENPDGTFSKDNYPFGAPGGYTALDLYIMGFLPPDKVPDTFVLTNLQDLGDGRYSGTKLRVRIQDIISVMGPRLPASADAQRIFHMKLYLVHEPGRDVDPAMLERAQHLSVAVANFFHQATGGEMQVVPSGE